MFKISTNGALTSLYSFTDGNDGGGPNGLVQGSDGYFYGTTGYGGTNDSGTVFKISTSGVLTSLYSFTGVSDGGVPYTGLVQCSDGDFYGTTGGGGVSGFGFEGSGTVFKISTNGALTSITIPDSVTSIGDYAFAGSSLTNVTIPVSVTNIGEHAFFFCNNLTNATIANGVTSIGDYAFAGSGLTGVTIPNSVTGIGDHVFAYCESLTAITVAAQNSFYSSLNGVLFNENQTTLVKYPALGGTYTIPGSVTSIGDYAFVSSELTGVTIPNSVTSIGVGTFYGCGNLASVTIPNSVINIGDSAFFECSGLANAIIGNGITNIGDSVFEGCGLTSVTIPNSILYIGDSAFSDCSGLTNATIGNGVTSIGVGTFENSGLTSVTIPDSITNIGDGAFSNCTSLTSFNIGSGVNNIGDETFSGSGLTSVTIPNSITNIGDEAFSNCGSLTNVNIGNGIDNIGESAFSDCTSLTSIYFTGNAPTADLTTFVISVYDYEFWKEFYIATAYHLPGITGRGDFSTNTGIPTALWLPQVQTGDANFGVRTNQFGFNINWASGQIVVVEACTDLANPVWQPVQTNTLSSDSFYFSDPQWTNYPARFYRLRSP